MRNRGLPWVLGLVLGSMGCQEMSFKGAHPSAGPGGGGLPPAGPAPTGTRWAEVPVENRCGRKSFVWVIVDEVCGDTERPDRFEVVRAPMFRDGARLSDVLYAVDGTNLWTLDASDDEQIRRLDLKTGIGFPMSVAGRGDELYIAAGPGGLLELDVSTSTLPRVVAQVAGAEAVLDVVLTPSTAIAAIGGQGVAEIDLEPPYRSRVYPTLGYGAAVAQRDDLLYVAHCNGLSVFDRASGRVLGMTWVPTAYRGDTLIAPAKDVVVVGDVAFVAAGRFGVVTIDVSIPTSPFYIGNCTLENDLSYYVNGLAHHDGKLFVAAGEWGVDTLDVRQPAATCTSHWHPRVFEVESAGDGDCSDDAPWVDLPPPPAPRRDPVQVLAAADRVYAFGDASRIGLRAVDVYTATTAGLVRAGRYEEPRRIDDIAASGGRVLIRVGTVAELHQAPDPQVGLQEPIRRFDEVRGIGFANGSRWVIAMDRKLLFEDGTRHLLPLHDYRYERMVTAGGRVVLPFAGGVHVFDGISPDSYFIQSSARWPVATMHAGHAYFTSAEWPDTMRADGSARLAPHRIFAEADIYDPAQWRLGAPSRLLIPQQDGLLEVARYAKRAGLRWHRTQAPVDAALPVLPYVDGEVAPSGHLVLLGADRGAYRSQLVTVALGDPATIVDQLAFSGVGRGLAVDRDRVLVADADRGIRLFDLSNGRLAEAGVVEVGTGGAP